MLTHFLIFLATTFIPQTLEIIHYCFKVLKNSAYFSVYIKKNAEIF